MRLHVWWIVVALVWAGGCSSDHPTTTAAPSSKPGAWVEDDVSFVTDGLTTYGTYRHREGAPPAAAALLISESGSTDRNGDNAVAGKIGTLRALATLLSDRGVATLRYDKVGTGKTGLGPYDKRAGDVGNAVFTEEAKGAVRFLAEQKGTDPSRISAYGHGEGAVRALTLATDTSVGAPKIHALGLLAPLAGRYLDLVTERVRKDLDAQAKAGQISPQQAKETLEAWLAAVAQARANGTVPDKLPHGLSAILNPGNVKAVLETDAIDPLALAAQIPAGTPVLLTCSDSDGQASCEAVQPLANALAHSALTFVQLKGVSHVLKDDPTDNIGNYAKDQPLSPQFVDALNSFVRPVS
ncbi:MAG: uncharacterized protein QOH60_4718 [Mycobacterium sp.]|nr:uncharacterized protein [Mycobacterium sp.]